MDMHSFVPGWGNESPDYEGSTFFFFIQQKSAGSKAGYECKIDYFLLFYFGLVWFFSLVQLNKNNFLNRNLILNDLVIKSNCLDIRQNMYQIQLWCVQTCHDYFFLFAERAEFGYAFLTHIVILKAGVDWTWKTALS